MPKRILVFSASVGAGHMRAAQAIEIALREVAPGADVQNIDVLELTNSTFRRLYGRAYIDLVNRAPHILGYLYDLMDQPSHSGKNRGDRFRLALDKLNLTRFVDLLGENAPDLVINTHFLPASIIANLRREGKCSFPQAIVTTDFDTHRLWVNEPCDQYFVATGEGAVVLQSWGVSAEKISVTGIPILPAFASVPSRDDVLTRHGLWDDRPIVLQLAGGFGVGPIGRIHEALLAIRNPLEIIVVTGHNAHARVQLESMACPPRHRRQVLGFTYQMDELMSVADLVVSKPGGLTTSETLARGAAMVIVDPIPGQESRNSDFLLEHGAAIKVNNISALAWKIEQLLGEPRRLEALKASAKAAGRPRAVFDIVEKSLTLMK